MRKSVPALLLIVVLLVAACGPAMIPAAAPETETGEVFVIALPRIVISFDETGRPALEGLPVESLTGALGMPLDLSMLRIDPFYTQWAQATNVQHIELRQTGNGLAILVNGQPMPHIGWTDTALQQTTELAPLFQMQGELISKLVPILSRIGVSVAVKFPVQEGADPIPFASDEIATASPAEPEGAPSAVVAFEVKYDDQGVPSILGISARDLEDLGIQAPLALDPSIIALLQQNNIQNLEILSQANGLFIFINGTALPHLAWDKGMLTNAADLYAQLNGNTGMPPQYVQVIQEFLPLISDAMVDVLFHFPVPAGVERLPARMH